jgi:hypothetical protein
MKSPFFEDVDDRVSKDVDKHDFAEAIADKHNIGVKRVAIHGPNG